MPKILSYPKSSQARALVLAKAVESLGGSSSQEMAAEKIGMKLGGGFNTIVSGAVKYGFISNKRGSLGITSVFRELSHAYSEDETKEFLRRSLLSVPLYRDIVDRFKGNHIPTDILDKLLVREMGVDQSWASKVSKYFLSDAKACGLITEDDRILSGDGEGDDPSEAELDEQKPEVDATPPQQQNEPEGVIKVLSTNPDEFVVSIVGPGMNTSITIVDEDDMMIVDATLKKIRRKLAVSE